MKRFLVIYALSALLTTMAYADAYQRLLQAYNNRQPAKDLYGQIGKNLSKRIATEAERSNLSFIAIYGGVAKWDSNGLLDKLKLLTKSSSVYIDDTSLMPDAKRYRTEHYVNLVVLCVASHLSSEIGGPVNSQQIIQSIKSNAGIVSIHSDVLRRLRSLKAGDIQGILNDYNFDESYQLAKEYVKFYESLRGSAKMPGGVLHLLPNEMIRYQEALRKINDLNSNVRSAAAAAQIKSAREEAERRVDIHLISATKYVSTKTIPYKEIDGSTSQDEVHFVFEKLGYRNFEFWHEYFLGENVLTDNKQGLCAFKTTLDIFRRQGFLSESQRELMKKFIQENSERLRQGDPSISEELDKFSEGSAYDIWIAYATRKNPRIETVLREDIEMVVSVFLGDAPVATPIGITRSFAYSSLEKKPHIGLAMQLHGFWAKASEAIYGPKLYAVTYPTPHMYKIMEKALKGKEFGSLDNGLRNYPSPWSCTDPRTGESIEFPQPAWFPPYEDPLFAITRGHSELSALVSSLGNQRVVIDMRALISLWDSPAVA